MTIATGQGQLGRHGQPLGRDARRSAGEHRDIVISRTGATTNPLTVNFRASGNAVSESIFEALPGSSVSTTVSGSNSYTSIVRNITIPAGESTVALTLTPIDDSVYELSE